ncbi:MAG: DUF3795 domain-containing protein [Candidatus Methanomethylophilaceae archaeon]|nr:DUF3795 domain-containing protein [Candidatus Methanomethylophilaceae archaeon]
MNILIGCCGLDCGKCEARAATVNNDDSLRRKVAEKWSELNGVPITPYMINCTGCRAEGVKTPFCGSMCQIRRCALSRGYGTCGECGDLDACDIISMITGNNPEALENLKGREGRRTAAPARRIISGR